jgi:ABC-2 type transport system ATP-binding protein
MILTTHYMEEAELLCDRIGIIDKGKVIALNTPGGLKRILKGEAIIDITHDRTIDPETILGMDFVEDLDHSKEKMRIFTAKKKEAISYLLANYGDKILSVDFHEPTLEDVFLHLTGKELRG